MKPSRFALSALMLAVAGVGLWLAMRREPSPESAQPVAPSDEREEFEPADLGEIQLAERDAHRLSVAVPAAEPPAAADESGARIDTPDVVRGRVIDDLGDPVQRFEIELRDAIAPATDHSSAFVVVDELIHTFTSDEGRFELPDLAPGEWIAVARHGTSSTRPARRTLPPQHVVVGTRSAPVTLRVPFDGPELVIMLPRSAVLTGRVESASGPVVNAGVFVRNVGERQDDVRALEPRARTDERGAFEVTGVQSGALLAMATHAEFADSEWTPVAVAPGERAEVVLRLGEGGRIHGVIDLSEGELADREVDLFSFRGLVGWRSTRSDSKGEFVIEHVIPQDYIIELRPPGYPFSQAANDAPSIRKRISVSEGATTEVVFGRMQPALQVTGRVLCAGAAIPGVEVAARARGGGEDRGQSVATDGLGAFALELDGPGEYVFHVAASYGSYFDFERGITSSTELLFELPGGAILGVVLAPDDRPLARIPVTVIRDGESMAANPASFWQHHRRTYTDAQGAFDFKWLSPGTYTLRAPDGFLGDSPPPRSPYGGVVFTNLAVDGHALERTLRLTAEGRISGRVVEAGGTPVAGAWIQVFDSPGIARFATDGDVRTDALGVFEVLSMAPGSYTVAARTRTRRAISPLINVTAGATAETRIELP